MKDLEKIFNAPQILLSLPYYINHVFFFFLTLMLNNKNLNLLFVIVLFWEYPYFLASLFQNEMFVKIAQLLSPIYSQTAH